MITRAYFNDDAPPTQITLKSSAGLYVSAEYGGGIDPRRDPTAIAFTANRPQAGPFEQFGYVVNADGSVSLQTNRGTYWTAEGGGGSYLRSDATLIGAWEKFWPVLFGVRGGMMALRCADGVHYICAEEGTAPLVPLTATRTAIGEWESFTVDGLTPGLPARPDRKTLCGVQTYFQGLPVTLPSSGETIRFWDPMLPQYSAGDRAAIYLAKQRAENTHLNLTMDLRGLACLPELRAIIVEYLTVGKGTGVLLCCMGDGQTTPGGGYDPGALGREWLMANFDAIYTAMAGDGTEQYPNLCPYLVFCPGYDGVVPAWQPPMAVDAFTLMARSVIDSRGKGGALAMYLSAGYPTWGSAEGAEANNWKTAAGKACDVIVYEGPIDMGLPNIPTNWPAMNNDQRTAWTQVWEVCGRMVRPFTKSAAQIATGDDPNPPFLLDEGTPRGPYTFVFLEWDTFREQKGGGLPLALVEERRAAVRAQGVEFTG